MSRSSRTRDWYTSSQPRVHITERRPRSNHLQRRRSVHSRSLTRSRTTVRAGEYERFPAEIFNQSCAQHEPSKMREILDHYRMPFSQGASKNHLLQHLLALQNRLQQTERATISKWLDGAYGQDSLATVLRRSERRNSPRSGERISNRLGHLFSSSSPSSLVSTRECMICVEDLDLRQFPTEKVTAACNHNPTVCKGCLTKSINIQIPDVAWDQVKCPQCSVVLPFEVVKKYASPAEFERYVANSFFYH
jgi:hypothetical protein